MKEAINMQKKNGEKQTPKGVGKRMRGWLIAIIIIVVLFIAGAICCSVL
jgi:hypothetical protein